MTRKSIAADHVTSGGEPRKTMSEFEFDTKDFVNFVTKTEQEIIQEIIKEQPHD